MVLVGLHPQLLLGLGRSLRVSGRFPLGSSLLSVLQPNSRLFTIIRSHCLLLTLKAEYKKKVGLC